MKIALKEAVERPGAKKAKKPKKKKGKKKDKKDKEEKVEDKMTLNKQIKIIETAYKDMLDMKEPDFIEEKVHDIFAIDMDIDIAIRVIQNNERGRQGIDRIQKIRKIIKMQKKEKEMQKLIKRGGRMEQSNQMKEQKAAEAL